MKNTTPRFMKAATLTALALLFSLPVLAARQHGTTVTGTITSVSSTSVSVDGRTYRVHPGSHAEHILSKLSSGQKVDLELGIAMDAHEHAVDVRPHLSN
jgi:hypothetical protein